MANDDKKKAYVPYWKPHAVDNSFYNSITCHLVESLDDLDNLLNNKYKDAKYMAFDIETTGLDPTVDDAEIIGYSFSFDQKDGYYVAVNHTMSDDVNVGVEGLQLIYDKMLNVRVFAANLQFDFIYMEYEGERFNRNWDMSKVDYYDIFVGLYLADSNVKFPSLKKAALFWLGFSTDTFSDTLGDAYNFKYVSARDAYIYGATDALMTYALAPISLKFYKEAGLSGKIDNEFIYPLAYMLKGTIQHNITLAQQWEKELQERRDFLETEIYKLIGKPFKISSPKQLSDALLSIGFDTGVKTKSGYMKAGMEELEKQNKITPNPIVALLVEFKKLEKTLSTYIRPFLEQYNNCGSDRWRYCYHLYSAPTCRLSGGKDGKNSYYAKVNAHCVVGGTKVFTTNGPKNIRDINIGDFVWDGEQYQRVANHFCNGIRDVYKVKTIGGYYEIISTDQHKYYSATDKEEPSFRKLCDLKEGDYIMVNTKSCENNMTFSHTPVEQNLSLGGKKTDFLSLDFSDKELWFLVGFICGGGHFRYYTNHLGRSYPNMIRLTIRESFEGTYSRFKSLFDKYHISYRDLGLIESNTREGRKRISSRYSIDITSTRFSQFIFDFLGDINRYKKSNYRKLPKKFYHLSTICREAFLGGFVMKSSDTQRKGTTVTVEVPSMDDALDYELAFKSVGIMAQSISDNDRYYVALGGPQQYNQHKLHMNIKLEYNDRSKSCPIPDILRDNTSIHFYNGRSRNPKTCVRYFNKGLGFNYDNFWTRIESIEYIGEELVYDIEVENTHRYIANGILVHNSITKPHSKMWYVHDWHEGDTKHEGDIVVLDWRFSLKEPSDYQIEGFDPQYNLRSIFKPNDNNYWVSIDFSAEELRLIANYSKAKVWTQTFLEGGDLHTNMAKTMWGEENFNHDLRKKAKGMNFGAIYGLSVSSIARQFELSMEDAQDLYNKFWAAIPEVTAFQKRTIRNAKKTGTVYNFFGRPRRVKHWLSSSDRKDVGFGERTCKNSPIQSSGADIMKLAMIKIYRKILRNPEYEGKVQFLSTIHDEVNLSIDYTDREMFMKIFTDFYNCMYCKFKGWEVPFEAGIEIGETWGGSFEFIWNEDKTRLIPNMEYKPRVKEVKTEAVDVGVENIKINSDDDFSFDLDF